MFDGGNGNFLNPRPSANVIRSLDVAINDTRGMSPIHPSMDPLTKCTERRRI